MKNIEKRLRTRFILGVGGGGVYKYIKRLFFAVLVLFFAFCYCLRIMYHKRKIKALQRVLCVFFCRFVLNASFSIIYFYFSLLCVLCVFIFLFFAVFLCVLCAIFA